MFDADKKRFDVEHALSMYATSYAILPAAAIYDVESLKSLSEVTSKCHIYVIGHAPKISIEKVEQHNQHLHLTSKVGGEIVCVKIKLPEGAILKHVGDRFHVFGPSGEEYGFEDADLALAIKRQHPMVFDVLYIGQAYGKEGSRTALDRLRKHETLQRISLSESPAEKQLMVILLEIVSGNRMMTMFNPRAANTDDGDSRIKSGLEKLFKTTEKERVSLYEAGLIRYFRPKYNKEFKDSFPSTNMKVLSDCYKKDFSGLIAEICFDDLPWNLQSEAVAAKQYHIARYDLHSAEERSMFFSKDRQPRQKLP